MHIRFRIIRENKETNSWRKIECINIKSIFLLFWCPGYKFRNGT